MVAVEKLGLEPLYRYEVSGTGAKVAFLGLSDFRMEVFEVEGSPPLSDHARETSTDLDGVVAGLGGRGVEFATGALEVPGSGGERFAFFRDNNGILIELYEPLAAHERAGGVPGEGAS